MRPNIHVEDISDFYIHLLDCERDDINGEAFNVSHENDTVMGLAELIRDVLDNEVAIEVEPTDDERSYHLSADKAADILDFYPEHAIEEAIRDLQSAYRDEKWSDHDAPIHHNVEWMQEHPEDWHFGSETYLEDESS